MGATMRSNFSQEGTKFVHNMIVREKWNAKSWTWFADMYRDPKIIETSYPMLGVVWKDETQKQG